MEKLKLEFYQKDALTLAKDLLGKTLVVKNGENYIKAKIVEVEAYTGEDDRACHTFGGRHTKRTETMYMRAGHAYVYKSYGIHNLLNIVSGHENGEAVLIRAVEPIGDLDTFSKNRFGKEYEKLSTNQKKNLTNGPGKFTQAMGIDMSFDKEDFLGDRIFLGYAESPKNIKTSKRIGIENSKEAKDYLYRFYIEGNGFVSK